MMLRYLVAEILKLRRSLVLLPSLAAPLLVAIVAVLIGLHSTTAVPLDRYAMTACAFWAFAMLPLSLTALSVLMAQMEHAPKIWDHLLALPGARRWLFLAKASVMMALIGGMTLMLYALIALGARLIGAVRPIATPFDAVATADVLARMFLASGLMAVIQLWAALRFRSFVPPLILGILGTFVSVAAASARQGAYFPWLMPLHIMSVEPAMALRALRIGSFGGVIALIMMQLDLRRREAV